MGDKTRVQRSTKDISDRLSRCEGHIRAIRGMIEADKSCEALFVQLAAVRSAINEVSLRVYEKHLDHCLSGKQGKQSRELRFISKLMLSGKI
jgi:DNA-binding FrmR family transcriptional regulator